MFITKNMKFRYGEEFESGFLYDFEPWKICSWANSQNFKQKTVIVIKNANINQNREQAVYTRRPLPWFQVFTC